MRGLTGSIEPAGSARPGAYRGTRRAMRIVRPQPAGLRCRVRLADGRVFTGALAPRRHRAIQLGLLHADSPGFVELTPGSRRADGTLAVDRRRRPEHYLPGGGCGDPRWLERLLAHAERIVAGDYARPDAGRPPREEAFAGVAPRLRRAGAKDAVAATCFLWVDVDAAERLDALWALLAERPCHLLVESGGSGGAHAYWRLDHPLAAVREPESGPGAREPIERANDRLIHALGVDAHGRPDVADPQCRERARVMRLAGTVNHKSGSWARVTQADLALAPYPLAALVGDLPDPPASPAAAARRPRASAEPDPLKRIAPPVYFARLAGIAVPRGGLVHCPAPAHEDTHPSCSVGLEPDQGWCCHGAGCGARGTIYDLASVLDGGPWGRELRGEAFNRARARAAEAFGEASQRPIDVRRATAPCDPG